MDKTDLDQQISDTSVCFVCPPDLGCVGHGATDIDNQIADVERQLAALRTSAAATARIPRNKKLRKEQQAEIAALQAKHEQLVRRVQWATVGATKPGEVL